MIDATNLTCVAGTNYEFITLVASIREPCVIFNLSL